MHVSEHRLFFHGYSIVPIYACSSYHASSHFTCMPIAKYFTPLRIKWLRTTQYLTWRRYVYDRCISSIVWLDEQSLFVHPDMLGSHLVDQEDRPCHLLSADRALADHSPDRSTVPQTKQTAVLWWFHTSLCGSCPTNKRHYNYSIITLYS